MKGLAQQISEYQGYHQKQTTQITHYVGVPLIIFSFLIVLGWIHITIPGVVSAHLACLASLALVIYYFFFDWMLALAIAVILLILNFIANFISQPYPSLFGFSFFLVCFITGAALQFIGHRIEGNKPTLMDYVNALLIAPICLVAELFFKFGYKEDLKKEVEKQA